MAKKKNNLQAQLQNPAASILKLLERISDRNLSESFRLWITACSLTLEHQPALLRRALFTGEIKNTPEELEPWNKAGLNKLSQSTFQIFAEALAILQCAAQTEVGELTYEDTVGEIYMMTLEGARWNQDQFYTPQPICDMMAMMLYGGDVETEYEKRKLAAEVSSTEIEPLTVNDPCCGSGRMLLAFAKQVPRRLIDIGFVEFYGQDSNYLAVEMCKINCRLYGLTGKRHAETLEAETNAGTKEIQPNEVQHVNITKPIQLKFELSA